MYLNIFIVIVNNNITVKHNLLKTLMYNILFSQIGFAIKKKILKNYCFCYYICFIYISFTLSIH